jgi:hypothetical protein
MGETRRAEVILSPRRVSDLMLDSRTALAGRLAALASCGKLIASSASRKFLSDLIKSFMLDARAATCDTRLVKDFRRWRERKEKVSCQVILAGLLSSLDMVYGNREMMMRTKMEQAANTYNE